MKWNTDIISWTYLVTRWGQTFVHGLLNNVYDRHFSLFIVDFENLIIHKTNINVLEATTGGFLKVFLKIL